MAILLLEIEVHISRIHVQRGHNWSQYWSFMQLKVMRGRWNLPDTFWKVRFRPTGTISCSFRPRKPPVSTESRDRILTAHFNTTSRKLVEKIVPYSVFGSESDEVVSRGIRFKTLWWELQYFLDVESHRTIVNTRTIDLSMSEGWPAFFRLATSSPGDFNIQI